MPVYTWFLKSLSCRCVCMSLRPYITSGVIWTLYEWLHNPLIMVLDVNSCCLNVSIWYTPWMGITENSHRFHAPDHLCQCLRPICLILFQRFHTTCIQYLHSFCFLDDRTSVFFDGVSTQFLHYNEGKTISISHQFLKAFNYLL